MIRHKTNIRVRYGETDQMGYMYYGVYAQYYEVGRVEMLRSAGITYRQMEEDIQVMMPVMKMSSKYIRPATYDDLLTVETIMKDMPDRDIHFYYEVYRENNELINTGEVVLCFVDMKAGKRVRCPELILDKLNSMF